MKKLKYGVITLIIAFVSFIGAIICACIMLKKCDISGFSNLFNSLFSCLIAIGGTIYITNKNIENKICANNRKKQYQLKKKYVTNIKDMIHELFSEQRFIQKSLNDIKNKIKDRYYLFSMNELFNSFMIRFNNRCFTQLNHNDLKQVNKSMHCLRLDFRTMYSNYLEWKPKLKNNVSDSAYSYLENTFTKIAKTDISKVMSNLNKIID